MEQLNNKQTARIIKVQADKYRLKIVNYIKSKGIVSAQDLLKELNISASTLSFHLKKMKACKLITSYKEGKNLFYKLNKQTLSNVYKFMENLVTTSLDKFKDWNPKFMLTEDEYLSVYNLHSDPIRLQILQIVAANPGISAKELAIDTKQSEPNLSFHLKKLVKEKWLSCKKVSNQHLFWLDVDYCLAFHMSLGNKEKER